MQNQILSLLINSLMAGLLIATILYCLRLNKRIRLLQDSKSELARIIREFDESTQRATQNINEIHAATMRISENIQHKIDKANYLADDLEMMIERAGKLGGGAAHAPTPRPAPMAAEPPPTVRRLADILPAKSPEAPKAAATTPPMPEEAGRRPLRSRSRAEQDLLNLMGKKQEN